MSSGADRWVDAIAGRHGDRLRNGEPIRVGALHGDGVGPEVIDAALAVLTAACGGGRNPLQPEVGPSAPEIGEGGLTEATAEFCRRTFAAGGAVLTGPRGGRWVYELRRAFDLFCKISPLTPSPAIAPDAGPTWPDRGRGLDILIVREQTAGVYQGSWSEADARRDGHLAEHSFSYSSREVRRIVEVGLRLAETRRGRLDVIVKRGGVPSISRLWEQVATELMGESGIAWRLLDVDFATYQLLREPGSFDVVVAPNLFGDVLADAGGVLLGSRGLCFGASFDDARAAVYGTNHGSAHDLAGTDRANPVAQILVAAAMLRESFALEAEARAIESAVTATWRDGWRTDDLAEAGCRSVGTREFAERVGERLAVNAGPPRGPR